MVHLLPFPDGLDELLSAKVVTSLALAPPQHVLYNALGGNTGVIAARKPEGRLAVHAAPSDHEVLQRVTQGVAHVQSTSDIGRRVNNDEASRILDSAIGLEFGLEQTLLLPPAVPRRLDSNGVVGLEMGVVERSDTLLFAFGGIFDVLGQRLLLGLLLLDLLLLGGFRGGRDLCLLGVELGLLLGLLSLLFHCAPQSADLRSSQRVIVQGWARTLLCGLHLGRTASVSGSASRGSAGRLLKALTGRNYTAQWLAI